MNHNSARPSKQSPNSFQFAFSPQNYFSEFSNKTELGNLLFRILTTHLRILGNLPTWFSNFLSEICCAETSIEFPFLLCTQELVSPDFLFLILNNGNQNDPEFQKTILNYLYLNSISNKNFAFLENSVSNSQKLELAIHKVFTNAIKSMPQQSLLLLPTILTHVSFPIYYIDFVRKVFESSEQIAFRILALESLLVLIGQFNYEYQDFYPMLFKLLQNELSIADFSALPESSSPSFLKNKYTPKFIGLLDIALKPNSLSKTVIASFLKILFRVLLKVNAESGVLVAYLIFNIIKRFFN